MSPGLLRYVAGSAALMIGWWPLPAPAESQLTDFNGTWRGAGTDRPAPFTSAQRTACHMSVRAGARHMASRTVCRGQSGLSKVLTIDITVDGSRFSGSASQTKTTKAGVETLTGSVEGERTQDTATFQVRFPGATPNARVDLRLIDPNSFSMRIAALGFTLTDVVLRRAEARERSRRAQ